MKIAYPQLAGDSNLLSHNGLGGSNRLFNTGISENHNANKTQVERFETYPHDINSPKRLITQGVYNSKGAIASEFFLEGLEFGLCIRGILVRLSVLFLFIDAE